jgi:CxxC motif-containing protein
VDISGNKAVNVRGAICPKGILYAASEIECPTRVFTATALAKGLSIKLIPVKTDKPIPKKDLLKAAEEVFRLRVSRPVKVGNTIVDNFLGLGVKLVATREAD